MDRVTYKCKKCSWKKSISAQWGDISPKMCGNKKCLTSFLKYPDSLEVIKPTPPKAKVEAPKEQKSQWKSKKEKKEVEQSE